MFSNDKFRVLFAEFLGTMLLSMVVLTVSGMFGLGTAAWYISISAGATLALIVMLIGNISGAHVNPAVTLGLWTLKKIQTKDAVFYVSFQLLGGAIALMFYNYLTGIEVPTLVAESFEWNVFWAEVTGAAIFGMGIAAAAANKLEGGLQAITIGISLTFGALVASVASAGFLNPAVALANNALDTTLVVAPIIGMVMGMNLYASAFAPETAKKKRK